MAKFSYIPINFHTSWAQSLSITFNKPQSFFAGMQKSSLRDHRSCERNASAKFACPLRQNPIFACLAFKGKTHLRSLGNSEDLTCIAPLRNQITCPKILKENHTKGVLSKEKCKKVQRKKGLAIGKCM